ncbi:MAG: hypothetical protein C5B54_03445 [Acidobacteria bacterium]|nr:MAG: hypothetical protein C5B54_03445 [Acidobacteriota bacterium]
MITASRFRTGSACLLTLFLIATPLFAKENAKQLYENATTLQQKLKSTDNLQKQQSEWKKVIDAFRRVYYSYPSSSYSDNSLFQVGALYAEMGARFDDALFYRRACSAYQFLIEQYSSSSLVVDAMLEYIRISRDELHQQDDAEDMAAKLKKRSPKMAAALSKPASDDSGGRAVLKSLRHYTGDNYSRIVLDFDREVSFKRNRITDPDRLYFDFNNTSASKELLKQNFPVDDGFIKQIRVGQNQEKTARVVVDVKSIENYDVFPLYHPFRLIIDVQGKKTSVAKAAPQVPAPAPATATSPATNVTENQPVPLDKKDIPLTPPEMAQANTSGRYSLARQLGLKVNRIVVDPGHGGQDPGAMHNGLVEKDITLDVSLRLKKILEDTYNYDVMMTRGQDKFIALEERTAYANSNSADLFVSVHVNSSRNKRVRGVETYYLNFATTPAAMEVAARENAIAEKNMGELQKLTAAIALNSKIEESRELATLIQNNLVGSLNKRYSTTNLGVKQAPFYVLIGAQMPSILAEISFISNEKEADLLGDDSYKQSVAQGIARGIQNYIETLADTRVTQNFNFPKAAK